MKLTLAHDWWRVRPFGRIDVLLLTTFLAISCSGDGGSPLDPSDAPPGHIVRQGSAFHAPGLHDPLENCIECHGGDLRGGANGEPSCFECHGNRWD